MQSRLWTTASLALLFSLVLLAALPAAGISSVAAQDSSQFPDGKFVVRVYYDTPDQISALVDFDLFEYNNKKEQYVLVAVDKDSYAQLLGMGMRTQIDLTETAKLTPAEPQPGQDAGIPGYPCYRTVEETFATGDTIIAAHPTLASFVDAGDSWEKATAGGLPGYDMKVLKLTNSAVSGSKPKLFITAAIHAREYTTAELVTRFAEYLVDNYNTNADATWLLDHHEIHIMLHTNPDGRKQAETGLSWRKNTNQNYCGVTSTSRGADLNRNFVFQWGCCGGSSGSQCSETYRGPSPASEPEVQAVQTYLRTIFPDQRADPLTEPAPVDATGVYLDVHSYSELVLWPWGFTSTVAPNGPALQTLGRKFAYFNNYTPEQAIGLYATDGTTDDFGYGDLGVASYTFELGTSFFQDCSTFENAILPDNLQALIYAAKVVRTPYMTPAGPDALTVTAAPATVTPGQTVNLTATINDTRFNNSNGAEPTQAVAAAEYYVDTPPWGVGAVAYPMAAADGTFNSTIENVVASVNTTGLSGGRHIVFVRGKDASNNWGAISAAFLDVTAFSATPANQTVCSPNSALYNISVGYAGQVTFNVTGNPAGTTTNFSVNPVAGPGNTVLTIGNTAAAAPGAYSMTLNGAYTGGSQNTPLQLIVSNASPGSVTLTAPANGATNVSATPTFTWSPVAQAASYSIQVATSPSFANIVASASGLTATSFTPAGAFNTSTTYYWRVWAENACGAGAYSAVYSFSTVAAPGDCGPGLQPSIVLTEGFEGGANGWTLGSGSTGNTWALWGTNVHSGSFAYHAAGSSTTSDQRLVSPPIVVPSSQSPVTLKFWNRQVLESRTGGCYDAGILEVSTNGGGTWTQITSGLLTDPYNGSIASGNPLVGLNGWCGDPQDWLNSIVDINPYAGQTVQFRFRVGTDTSVGREGWTIDDVVVQSCQVACPYNVNGIGGVDIVDIQLVAGAFGTNTPAYDFDIDGTVDVDDIVAVAQRWIVGCQ